MDASKGSEPMTTMPEKVYVRRTSIMGALVAIDNIPKYDREIYEEYIKLSLKDTLELDLRNVKRYAHYGSVDGLKWGEFPGGAFVESKDFDLLTLELAYEEDAARDREAVLCEQLNDHIDALKAAEDRARVAEEAMTNPAQLHTHILRTLNHAQIMHIIGDDVAKEVRELTADRDEWKRLASERIEFWECPECLFRMAVEHRDSATGEYSCPNCNEERLTRSLSALQEERKGVLELLRDANVLREKEWDPEGKISVLFHGNEFAGEVGEACNIIKKLERERMGIRGTRATVAELAEELADVVIVADLIALHSDIDLGKAVRDKFNKTSEKYGLSVMLASRPQSPKGEGQ